MRFDDDRVLALARAQSQRLAEARAAQPRRWRPPHRQPARLFVRWALAGAFLLLGSGALALVARHQQVPPPAPPVPPVEIRPPAPAVVHAQPAPVLPAKSWRRKIKKPPPAPFEDGDAEFILVAPHPPQPPLFSPEEWKRRGQPETEGR